MSGSVTGIDVDQDTIEKFNALKTRHEHGYLVLSIVNNKVAVEECGEPFVQNTGPIEKNKQSYLDLMERISNSLDPKFIVFDFQYVKKDGQRRERVIFISWCPDDAKINIKMIYSGTKESLKTKLNCDLYVQANDKDELSYQEIAEAIEKKG